MNGVFCRGDLFRDLKAEFGLSLLRSNCMIEGSLQGTADATGPKSYTYNASADYAYTKDVLFDRSVSPLRDVLKVESYITRYGLHPVRFRCVDPFSGLAG